jgi:uncharacterized membrane protein (UPF0127 family)
MAKVNTKPTYILLTIFVIPVVAFFINEAFLPNGEVVAEAITPALPPSESVVAKEKKDFTTSNHWQDIYPNTKSMKINDVSVNASIAKTWSERITGLSGTPYLPLEVVKLFVFDSPGRHSIWMKDMRYAIDILWVSGDGVIVHIEKGASPESYPEESFSPDRDAYYVIEAKAGFVDEYRISEGDSVVLPEFN